MSYTPPFFWLHIKKSGGSTCRRLLAPHYISMETQGRCPSFIQSSPEYWNDILNNSRMMLGEYQLRRSLFAKTYLYPESWNDLLSFAFSREPTDRCISMFYYLFFKNNKWNGKGLFERAKKSVKYKRPLLDTSSMFDVFLDVIEGTHAGEIHISQHFTAHTAPMFPDVTDKNGDIVLSRIYRLECMHNAVAEVFKDLDLPPNPENIANHNENKSKGRFTPNQKQVQRIQTLFAKDFELYEGAINV